jgi:hypothetical protein
VFTQLNPPIPLETPKGQGMAYAVIDYGPDYDLLWVVFDDASGEYWTWKNPKVRAVKNVTMGRRPEVLFKGELRRSFPANESQ